MRSWPSSVLSSPRVLVRSSRFFDHSWPALILAEDCDIVSDSSVLLLVMVSAFENDRDRKESVQKSIVCARLR